MNTNERGFTLIEVMIAISVLTVGILALQMMQTLSIDENSTAGGITVKSMLAASKIEQILDIGYNDVLLVDTDGDGTGQDANADGIDDDDNTDLSDNLAGEEFGLRDRQCCSGGLDPGGSVVAGCVRFADQCDTHEEYDIYWNIAVDHPVVNTKTITIIVVNTADQAGQGVHRAEYTYIKDDVI